MEHSPTPQTLKLVLHVQGNVTPFKNRKRSFVRRGKIMVVTLDRVKKEMERITRDFEFQLLAIFQAEGMAMASQLPSWIASRLPLDDSLDWITEQKIIGKRVKPSDARTEIEIEIIPVP